MAAHLAGPEGRETAWTEQRRVVLPGRLERSICSVIGSETGQTGSDHCFQSNEGSNLGNSSFECWIINHKKITMWFEMKPKTLFCMNPVDTDQHYQKKHISDF